MCIFTFWNFKIKTQTKVFGLNKSPQTFFSKDKLSSGKWKIRPGLLHK